MVELSSILSKRASEVKPPVLLPQGLYVAQIEKWSDVREIGDKKTPGIDCTYRVSQPIDVELPSDVELPRSVRQTHWLSEISLHRFKEFLTNVLLIEEGQKDLAEMIRESSGRMFRLEIIQKAYTPKGKTEPEMVNDVGNTFPLD